MPKSDAAKRSQQMYMKRKAYTKEAPYKRILRTGPCDFVDGEQRVFDTPEALVEFELSLTREQQHARNSNWQQVTETDVAEKLQKVPEEQKAVAHVVISDGDRTRALLHEVNEKLDEIIEGKDESGKQKKAKEAKEDIRFEPTPDGRYIKNENGYLVEMEAEQHTRYRKVVVESENQDGSAIVCFEVQEGEERRELRTLNEMAALVTNPTLVGSDVFTIQKIGKTAPAGGKGRVLKGPYVKDGSEPVGADDELLLVLWEGQTLPLKQKRPVPLSSVRLQPPPAPAPALPAATDAEEEEAEEDDKGEAVDAPARGGRGGGAKRKKAAQPRAVAAKRPRTGAAGSGGRAKGRGAARGGAKAAAAEDVAMEPHLEQDEEKDDADDKADASQPSVPAGLAAAHERGASPEVLAGPPAPADEMRTPGSGTEASADDTVQVRVYAELEDGGDEQVFMMRPDQKLGLLIKSWINQLQEGLSPDELEGWKMQTFDVVKKKHSGDIKVGTYTGDTKTKDMSTKISALLEDLDAEEHEELRLAFVPLP